MNAEQIKTLKMIASNCNLEKVQRDMITDIIKDQAKYDWHVLTPKTFTTDVPTDCEEVLVCYLETRDLPKEKYKDLEPFYEIAAYMIDGWTRLEDGLDFFAKGYTVTKWRRIEK